MAQLTTTIGTTVKKVIDKFGQPVDILKFDSMVVDQYRQGAPVFLDAVPVQAQVAMGLNTDQLAQIGLMSEKPIAGALTFSRLHLEEAFPALDIEEAITLKDEIGVMGQRWAIATVHVSGHINGIPSVIAVGLAVRPGKEKEPYP